MNENLAEQLYLIKNDEYHPYMLDYIYEFQDAFLEIFPTARIMPGRFISTKRQFLRLFRYAYGRLPMGLRFSCHLSLRNEASFAVVCGGDFAYCLPSAIFSNRNYLYMFDHWPHANEILIDWVRLFSINKIFFSALQSAELFNQSLGEERGIWVPEGIYPKRYELFSYHQKSIDVVEMGRRNEDYHGKIAPALNQCSYNHFFGRTPVNPLPKSKISICFPSAVTHPERSGYISTMTLRYLQSMISKCLIVGEAPYDMKYLFDYYPVVEADTDNPGDQLVYILRNFGDYIPLIEKNYQTVMEKHLWSNRMEIIRPYLQPR